MACPIIFMHLSGYTLNEQFLIWSRDIKNNSSNFINDHKFVKGKFAWQEGYGAIFIFTFAYRKCV